SQADCLPVFPDQTGWYGGDAAYSVPLPTDAGRTSLWLFGDSFVQRPDSGGGRQYPFVHNSIAVSHCSVRDDWSLDYFWGRDHDGEPRAFFAPDPEAAWVRRTLEETGSLPYYWLFDGFVAHDILFVGLLRVAEAEPRGPFNLPFTLLGMDLARIENFREAPQDWQILISTLSENPVAFPGSAFVVSGNFVHSFAFIDRGDGRSHRMLSRLDLDALALWQPNLSNRLETLAADSRWKLGFVPDDAMIVMDDDASEMSVHFDSEQKAWIAVYSHLDRKDDQRNADSVWIRRAQQLEGPWSAPEVLFEIPEMELNASGERDKNLFCYAAKAHPQFAAPGRLLITYVCSLFARNPTETLEVLRRLQETPGLYRARALSVPIPSDFEAAYPHTER
ncbi:MAG: hypothetical protein V3T64_14990, partial [Myxococcota bacterium]